MARLTFSLLGTFQATRDGEPISGFESDKVRALLAYLVIESNQSHRREKLAGLFWPERPDREARANLRYALSNLRKVVGDRDAAVPVLCATRQTIQFIPGDEIWVDALVFQDLVSKYPAAQDENQLLELREAVELYRGEFLEGFSLADSPGFSEWLLIEREKLKRQVLAALRLLSSSYEQNGNYELALNFAWQQVELEPWQEEAHRQVMRLLAASGQRSAALAQYEACRQALAEELEVEPAPETTRLYEQIRDGTWGTSPKEPPDIPASVPARSDAGHPLARRFPTGLQILVVSGLLLFSVILIFIFRQAFMRDVPTTTPTQFPISAVLHPSDARVVAACEADPPNKLCIIDPRSGSIVAIIDSPAYDHVQSASWSPDGERIAFSAALPGSSAYHIYLISPDGTGLEQLSSGHDVDHSPAWSPDGEEIAFIRAGELWTIHLEDGESIRLWGKIEQTNVVGMGWSPEGSQLAFANLYRGPQSSGVEFWIVDRDGSEPRLVRTFAGPFTFALVGWSPDGNQLLCYCMDPEREQGLLFNIDGTGEVQTFPQPGIPVTWLHTYWPQWGRSK